MLQSRKLSHPLIGLLALAIGAGCQDNGRPGSLSSSAERPEWPESVASYGGNGGGSRIFLTSQDRAFEANAVANASDANASDANAGQATAHYSLTGQPDSTNGSGARTPVYDISTVFKENGHN